jgi:hypothetical protein
MAYIDLPPEDSSNYNSAIQYIDLPAEPDNNNDNDNDNDTYDSLPLPQTTDDDGYLSPDALLSNRDLNPNALLSNQNDDYKTWPKADARTDNADHYKPLDESDILDLLSADDDDDDKVVENNDNDSVVAVVATLPRVDRHSKSKKRQQSDKKRSPSFI